MTYRKLASSRQPPTREADQKPGVEGGAHDARGAGAWPVAPVLPQDEPGGKVPVAHRAAGDLVPGRACACGQA